MSLALVHSRAPSGVTALPVRVEVHLSGGLPTMSIVGLPEAAVREAKDRVRAALLCSHFEFPQRRITINLAPADLPKACYFKEKTLIISGSGDKFSAVSAQRVSGNRLSRTRMLRGRMPTRRRQPGSRQCPSSSMTSDLSVRTCSSEPAR